MHRQRKYTFVMSVLMITYGIMTQLLGFIVGGAILLFLCVRKMKLPVALVTLGTLYFAIGLFAFIREPHFNIYFAVIFGTAGVLFLLRYKA